jgi:hypothetical protein
MKQIRVQVENPEEDRKGEKVHPIVHSEKCPPEWRNEELLYLLFQPKAYNPSGSVFTNILGPWRDDKDLQMKFFEEYILV